MSEDKCEYCDRMPVGQMFCEACGRRLVKAAVPPPPPPPIPEDIGHRPASKNKAVIGVLVAVIAVMAVVLIWVLAGSNTGESGDTRREEVSSAGMPDTHVQLPVMPAPEPPPVASAPAPQLTAEAPAKAAAPVAKAPPAPAKTTPPPARKAPENGDLDPKKRGELKVSSPGALTGGRSRASIQSVITQNMASLRSAYNKRLRDKPGLEGKITIKFAIDENGDVLHARIVGSTMNDAELENTVISWVASWNFGKADKPGDVTEITYPFVFSQ